MIYYAGQSKAVDMEDLTGQAACQSKPDNKQDLEIGQSKWDVCVWLSGVSRNIREGE